jgi:hypothetical protein
LLLKISEFVVLLNPITVTFTETTLAVKFPFRKDRLDEEPDEVGLFDDDEHALLIVVVLPGVIIDCSFGNIRFIATAVAMSTTITSAIAAKIVLIRANLSLSLCATEYHQ